jgi:hypothetical protein
MFITCLAEYGALFVYAISLTSSELDCSSGWGIVMFSEMRNHPAYAKVKR